jgi:hypothetical protein
MQAQAGSLASGGAGLAGLRTRERRASRPTRHLPPALVTCGGSGVALAVRSLDWARSPGEEQ